MTQNEMIRKYLEAGHSLTQIEALNRFGCFRLATRIFELKKSGMRIKTETVENKSTGKRYARYRLVKEEDEKLVPKPAPEPVAESVQEMRILVYSDELF